jgi:predicted porin
VAACVVIPWLWIAETGTDPATSALVFGSLVTVGLSGVAAGRLTLGKDRVTGVQVGLCGAVAVIVAMIGASWSAGTFGWGTLPGTVAAGLAIGTFLACGWVVVRALRRWPSE